MKGGEWGREQCGNFILQARNNKRVAKAFVAFVVALLLLLLLIAVGHTCGAPQQINCQCDKVQLANANVAADVSFFVVSVAFLAFTAICLLHSSQLSLFCTLFSQKFFRTFFYAPFVIIFSALDLLSLFLPFFFLFIIPFSLFFF